MQYKYLLGLGSNIGNGIENIKGALAMILEKSSLLAISNYYSSKALLPKGAPKSWDVDYVNNAVMINSNLNPDEFLFFIKEVESALGRLPQARRWSPRIIDIDILLAFKIISKDKAENIIYKDEGRHLTIPHPQLHLRDFVLLPAAEIARDEIHPELNKNIAELAKDIIISKKQKGEDLCSLITNV